MTDQINIPERLIDRFRQGRVALFVGAGCCRSAGLPGWRLLLEKIQKEFEEQHILTDQDKRQIKAWLKKVEDYPRIAKLFKSKSPKLYRETMLSIFDPDPTKARLIPPEYFKSFSSLPLTEIITTNFDSLIENSLPAGDWKSLTWQDNEDFPRYLSNPRPLVFHIHGRINRFGTLVHTLDEYSSLQGTDGDTARKFLQRIFEQNTILIAGYGLSDPVIRWTQEILNNEWNLEPDWYILKPEPEKTGSEIMDQEFDEKAPRLITYAFESNAGDKDQAHTDGITKWFINLGEKLNLHVNPDPDQTSDSEFPEDWTLINDRFLNSLPKVTTDQRQKYYRGEPATWGLVNQGFTVHRDVTDKILKLLEPDRDSFESVLLKGGGGEGKSTILMQVALCLKDNGYKVFYAYEGIADPFEILKKNKGMLALIIDQADLIKNPVSLIRFAKNRRHAIKILLGARSNEWNQADSGKGDIDRILKSITVSKITQKEASLISEQIIASSTVQNQDVDTLTRRMLENSNYFLLAAMLVATHGRPLRAILASVVQNVSASRNGTELLKCLGLVVALESKTNAKNQPYFCSFRLFQETLGISRQRVHELCRSLVGELSLRPRGGYRIETRHPVIAKELFPILFHGENPFLNESGIHKDLLLAIGNLKKEHVKPGEQKLLSVIPLNYVKARKYEIARDLFKTAFQIDPHDPVILQSWGVMEKKTGNPGSLAQEYSARWLFKKGTEKDSENTALWQAWGLMEKEAGNVGELDQEYSARWLFKKGTEKDPKHAPLWQAWGLMEKEAGNPGSLAQEYSARWLFKKGTEKDSKHAPSWQAWGLMEKEAGNTGSLAQEYSARWLFKKGTEADPKDAALWQAWGLMEKEAGNVGTVDQEYSARWLFKKGTEADPKNAPSWQAWGLMEKEAGNPGSVDQEYSARWLFKKGTEADPKHAPSWQAWGLMEKEAGNVGELDQECSARWLFKKGTEKDPKHAALWQAWGLMEKEAGNVGELDQEYSARWLFKKGTEADPKNAPSWQAWALMEKEVGNIGTFEKEYSAQWLFKKGTEKDPKHAPLWQAWGLMEKEAGNPGTVDQEYSAEWLLKKTDSKRFFEGSGEVDPSVSYHVYLKNVVNPYNEDIQKMINKGRYFCIFAPRQSGKTTFFKDLCAMLEKDSLYVPIVLSFQYFRSMETTQFYNHIQEALYSQLIKRLKAVGCHKLPTILNLLEIHQLTDHAGFYRLFSKLNEIVTEKRIVIFIDEFDGIPISELENFLTVLRELYQQYKMRANKALYSVGLVGVRDITKLVVGGISPFNIADQVKLPRFSLNDVQELYGQYTQETGQPFDQQAILKIFNETNGQPWLVNRLAIILTNNIKPETTALITSEDVDMATEMLLQERNAHFDNLSQKLEACKDTFEKIISDNVKYNPENKDQVHLEQYGLVINKNGMAVALNPIYIRRYSDSLSADIISKPAKHKSDREIYISYAWGQESEKTVDELEAAFKNKGIAVIRDKNELTYKDDIINFMKRIGRGRCVIVVISKKYLKSDNCMFELVQILKNNDFYDRIFPIVLADAEIYNPLERINYVKFWNTKIQELEDAISPLPLAKSKGFRQEIDSYQDISSRISELTEILKNMNTLTPDMHKRSGFSEIFDAIDKENRIKPSSLPQARGMFHDIRKLIENKECEKAGQKLSEALLSDPRNQELLNLHEEWRKLC
jgi:hypothetical protein